MNVLRDYNPRLFDILEVPYQRLSKRELSKALERYTQNQGYEIYLADTIDKYIDLTPEPIRELTGIFDMDRYYLVVHGARHHDWWDLVTRVYKRWKL